jgi:hypothetical protein
LISATRLDPAVFARERLRFVMNSPFFLALFAPLRDKVFLYV